MNYYILFYKIDSMKIRVVFCLCALVVAFVSCAKKEKIAIENTEPVDDFDLEAAQEQISEPDRFVSAIVLSPYPDSFRRQTDLSK